jgi:hypothetical protein
LLREQLLGRRECGGQAAGMINDQLRRAWHANGIRRSSQRHHANREQNYHQSAL